MSVNRKVTVPSGRSGKGVWASGWSVMAHLQVCNRPYCNPSWRMTQHSLAYAISSSLDCQTRQTLISVSGPRWRDAGHPATTKRNPIEHRHGQGKQLSPGGGIPDLDGAFVAKGGDAPAIRRPSPWPNGLGMPEDQQFFPVSPSQIRAVLSLAPCSSLPRRRQQAFAIRRPGCSTQHNVGGHVARCRAVPRCAHPTHGLCCHRWRRQLGPIRRPFDVDHHISCLCHAPAWRPACPSDSPRSRYGRSNSPVAT